MPRIVRAPLCFATALLFLLTPARLLHAAPAETTAAGNSALLLAGAGLSLDRSDYSDGITSRGINTDDRSATFGTSLHAGLSPMEWLTIKAGWRSLGLQRAENLTADFDLETTMTFLEADLLAPVSDRFQLGITAGTARWKVKESIEITSDVALGASVRGSDPYYGIIGRVSPPDSSVSVDFFARRYVIKDSELVDDLRFTSLGAAINVHF